MLASKPFKIHKNSNMGLPRDYPQAKLQTFGLRFAFINHLGAFRLLPGGDSEYPWKPS